MISGIRYGGMVLVVTAAVGMGCMTQAGAQPATVSPWNIPGMTQAPDAGAAADAKDPDDDAPGKDADIKTADTRNGETSRGETGDPKQTGDLQETKDLELDWSQLDANTSSPPSSPGSKVRVRPPAATGSDTSWSSQDKPNGAAAVSVKQAISPYWDARVGADMTVVREPRTLTGSDLLRQKYSSDGPPSQSSGAAWAAITAPGVGSIWDKTAIEARVDPSQDQSKLGTSLSKSLPLSEQYSLTLQNGYNVIQQSSVPVPGIGHQARSYETEQSAKLSIAGTGTSLIAGQSLSSADDKWLRKLGAEQKLFGGVSITGTIGETPLGTANKSVTAGFKHSW